MISAFVFDLDGTLVETEELKALSYARAARELRPEVREEAVIRSFGNLVGRARREVATALLERFDLEGVARSRMEELGADSPWQAYVRVRLPIYEALLADRDVVLAHRYPHNVALLHEVRRASYPTALSTMSHRGQVGLVLSILGLADEFDVVATREDVERGKPDPEIDLLVARELGVPPGECLVIEDSPAGVAAGLAAGMEVIAATTTLTRRKFEGTGLLARCRVVTDPRELPDAVRRVVSASGGGPLRVAATSSREQTEERRKTMELGMVGLGKMGGNMARRLLADGHRVVGYARRPEAVQAIADEGAVPSNSLEELVGKLDAPRVVWLMVPSGKPTEDTIEELAGLLDGGDTVVDGGNSNYHDTVRRAAALAEKSLHYVDVGTSGGVWGLAEGYSMMVGGEPEAVGRLRPALETLAPAPDKGWGHVGPSGSGHFVKMVHNGVEYGLMQAYAEGFALMRRKEEFGLDLHQVSEIWRHGSVVRSWLLDLAASALDGDDSLEGVAPLVKDSGEGRWTVVEAIDLGVAVPVISAALEQRFASQEAEGYAYKILNALRNQFGGHELERKAPANGKMKP